MAHQILAIDAGNSRLKFGLFVPARRTFYVHHGETMTKLIDDPETFPHCRRFMAVPVEDPIPWSTLEQWQPAGAVISGSNPKELERVLNGWRNTDLPVPLPIRDRSLIQVALDVDYPDKVGIDRLLGAVAANAIKPRSRPVIIVDSGTATTVNYISGEGVFCGGAILPGLEMSAKALNHYTAVLPFIPVQELGGDLPQSPGRNTREAIRNGLYWGQVGAIRELIRQICLSQQLNDPVDGIRADDPNSPWLILTGGGAPVLSLQFPGVLSIPSLGMHGLVITAWNQGL